MQCSVQQLEAAINFWRAQCPARGNASALAPEVSVLARVYALMIYHGERSVQVDTLDASAQQLLQRWCQQG